VLCVKLVVQEDFFKHLLRVNNIYNIKNILNKYMNNNNEIQSILKKIAFERSFNLYFFEKLSPELRNNYDIVMMAVSRDGSAIKYASKELRNNPKVVMASISQCGSALEFVSDELRNNYNIVLAAVSDFGSALKYASSELKNNYDIVLAAVSDFGLSFEYASSKLKNNFDIALAAVNHYGESLQLASLELKNNYEVVLAAVSKDGKALQYASSELQNNLDILRTYQKYHESLYYYSIDKYPHNYQQFYQERIDVLNRYREKELMLKNIQEKQVSIPSKLRKF
jgi:hypothetical protein